MAGRRPITRSSGPATAAPIGAALRFSGSIARRFHASHLGNDCLKINAIFRHNPGSFRIVGCDIEAPLPLGAGRESLTQGVENRRKLDVCHIDSAMASPRFIGWWLE